MKIGPVPVVGLAQRPYKKKTQRSGGHAGFGRFFMDIPGGAARRREYNFSFFERPRLRRCCAAPGTLMKNRQKPARPPDYCGPFLFVSRADPTTGTGLISISWLVGGFVGILKKGKPLVWYSLGTRANV